jgi:hypothetical protein
MVAALALLACLVFTGCGKEGGVSGAIEFRAQLVRAGGCSFTAEVTADFGDEVYAFTLQCESDADGTTDITIIQPETLAGITATVTDSGGQITYDGMAVDFGLLASGDVIPAAAPAIVVSCWGQEYIESAGPEEGLERVTYTKGFDDKQLTADTWFENGVPICAELCYNGQRILKLTITDFQFRA